LGFAYDGHDFWADISDIGLDADDDMDDVNIDADESILSLFLSFIHVKEVPFMMLAGVFLLTWGIVGLTLNYVIVANLKTFWAPLLIPSIVVTFVVSILFTKSFAKAISFIAPTAEKGATSIRELVGKTARVISGKVTTKFGQVRLRDDLGHSITVFCKIRAGNEIPEKGDEVLLLEYDDVEKKFEVEKFDVTQLDDVS
jgi:membrane protein implicated in regulation of membrane protease activity